MRRSHYMDRRSSQTVSPASMAHSNPFAKIPSSSTYRHIPASQLPETTMKLSPSRVTAACLVPLLMAGTGVMADHCIPAGGDDIKFTGLAPADANELTA